MAFQEEFMRSCGSTGAAWTPRHTNLPLRELHNGNHAYRWDRRDNKSCSSSSLVQGSTVCVCVWEGGGRARVLRTSGAAASHHYHNMTLLTLSVTRDFYCNYVYCWRLS